MVRLKPLEHKAIPDHSAAYMMKRPLIIGILFLLLSAPLPHAAAGDTSAPTKESLIKAAYLLNFARFTQWPDDAFSRANAPVVIGVIGTTPLRKALPSITQKKVQKRPLIIRDIKKAEDLKNCHILFVGENLQLYDGLDELFKRLVMQPTLTVSSRPEFSLNGGMLNFVLIQNKIRFEVNLKNIQRANLSMSSRLLKIATVVH